MNEVAENVTGVRIPGASHFIPEENPEAFASAVLDHRLLIQQLRTGAEDPLTNAGRPRPRHAHRTRQPGRCCPAAGRPAEKARGPGCCPGRPRRPPLRIAAADYRSRVTTWGQWQQAAAAARTPEVATPGENRQPRGGTCNDPAHHRNRPRTRERQRRRALPGLSIPVVIAGAATAHPGLHPTALAYCAAMAALAAVAAGSLLLRRRHPATGQGTGLAGPGPTAAIARRSTGRAGRPTGMVPCRAAAPGREPGTVGLGGRVQI
jgi:hypothetical protein